MAAKKAQPNLRGAQAGSGNVQTWLVSGIAGNTLTTPELQVQFLHRRHRVNRATADAVALLIFGEART